MARASITAPAPPPSEAERIAALEEQTATMQATVDQLVLDQLGGMA